MELLLNVVIQFAQVDPTSNQTMTAYLVNCVPWIHTMLIQMSRLAWLALQEHILKHSLAKRHRMRVVSQK